MWCRAHISNDVKEKLQNFFGSHLPPNCATGTTIRTSMYFIPVTEIDVLRIIINLPHEKTPGFDEIPVTVVKNCSSFLAPILVWIINTSESQACNNYHDV